MGGVHRPSDDPRRDGRLDIVHVNEIKGGAAATAHLVEFDSVHGRWHTPVEVDLFGRMMASMDWIDVPRRFVPAERKLYSWWSYRNADWRASNRGRRLDHILATPALSGALAGYRIDADRHLRRAGASASGRGSVISQRDHVQSG